jgi:hypothetical protein
MSKTPQFDSKIKEILDSLEPGERTCALTGEKWKMDKEEISWYRKFKVPPPDLSPISRRRMLWGFNVGVSIWWNKHAVTGKPLLSFVHPDNKIKVVPDKEWHAQDWGEKFQGQVDMSKPFFPQLRELVQDIPIPAQRIFGEVKNTVGASLISAEDSFMVFGGIQDVKHSAYGYILKNDEFVFDSCYAHHSSDSCALNNCDRMFNCIYSFQCVDCMSSAFLFDCRNCEFCFGSSNLRNKKYIFFNQQLSSQEYEQKMSEVDLSCSDKFEQYKKRFLEFVGSEAIWPDSFNIDSQDSRGEYLNKCLRCNDCYLLEDSIGCYHTQLGHTKVEESAFCSGIVLSSDCYYSTGVHSSQQAKICSIVSGCQNVEYCYNCIDCEYCFGCVGLKKQRYCILNKQYSEEEYWSVLDDLKCQMFESGEYGQYLPADFSPGGIEFTTSLYLDWSDEELERLGAVVMDPAKGTVLTGEGGGQTHDMKSVDEIPKCLKDATKEQIVNKAFLDKEIDRPFSIRENEFDFYKKHDLALPRRHYISRVKEVARLTNSLTSTEKQCSHCDGAIQVADNLTFSNRKVYCHDCYLKYFEQYG